MPETISMVQCPYCGDQWVRDDTELVCDQCIPALNVDLAVADLASALNKLEGEAPVEIRARVDLLTSLHTKLGIVIKKAKPHVDVT